MSAKYLKKKKTDNKKTQKSLIVKKKYIYILY